MKRIGLAAIVILMAASAPAFAEQQTQVDERQYIQGVQIESAALRPGERAHIRRSQRYVASLQRRARADGVVTRAERRQIAQAQRSLDRYVRAARAS